MSISSSLLAGCNRIRQQSAHGFSAFLLLASLVGQGCIETTSKMTINADASGTFATSFAISEDSIAQHKAVLKIKDQLGRMDDPTRSAEVGTKLLNMMMNPDEQSIRASLKAYEEYGLTISELKVETKSTRRHVRLKLAFKDLATLARCDIFKDGGFSLSRDASGNYVILREAVVAGMKPPSADLIQAIAPYIDGLTMTLEVILPGRIVKSNAHTAEGNSAKWSFEAKKNPDALNALQTQKFEIIFSGAGLDLPIINRQ